MTRGTVIELAKKLNLPLEEKPLTRFDVWTADECFLTGTAAEVIPVVNLDGRQIGDCKPGSITKRILCRFKELTSTTGTPIDEE